VAIKKSLGFCEVNDMSTPEINKGKDGNELQTCGVCGKPVAQETAKSDGDGKLVHAECYTSSPNVRPWRVVAEQASHEHDPEKLSELVTELTEAIDQQTSGNRARDHSDGAGRPIDGGSVPSEGPLGPKKPTK
jgi:hypothetical protein